MQQELGRVQISLSTGCFGATFRHQLIYLLDGVSLFCLAFAHFPQVVQDLLELFHLEVVLVALLFMLWLTDLAYSSVFHGSLPQGGGTLTPH